MPVLQKLVSLNQETVREKGSNKFESTRNVRKVRIICSDPYATDPSDDEGISRRNGKLFVREIRLPISSYQVLNASVAEGSVQDSNGGKIPKGKRVLTSRERKLGLTSRNYRGVRQRKWGKWAAEIHDPVKQKRIWLGTYRSAKEASMAFETKRIEFEALAYGAGCGEEKISCSVVLSKCSKNQDQNLADVGASESSAPSVALHASNVSPSPVLALDSSISASESDVKENEATIKDNVVEIEFGESGPTDGELMALAQIGKELNLDLELDSIMLDGDDFTTPSDDFVNGFENLPICGLLAEDQPGVLPDFDFNFDFEDYGEAFSWIEEAPALMNGPSPLNLACP